jgi:archaeal flagellar protein FlaJ
MNIQAIALFFSVLIPKSIIENKIKKWLIYAGSKDDERIWIGKRMFFATLIGLIGVLIPFSIFPLLNSLLGFELFFDLNLRVLMLFVFGLSGFFGTLGVFYLHVNYAIDARKKMVESILPDFLFLVGNNLKSGMTPFYAFRSAVRPEFGPLSEEIQLATKKSLGIHSFADSMKRIAKRIDSKVLEDTTRFFAHALRSGGKLAQLIETSATDIKQTNRLKRELVSSTKMYTLFIIFVVVIASPILLAVSVQFLTILTNIQLETAVGSAAAAQVGLAGGAISIDPLFMQQLGYILIISNSILASVFIGIISGGKLREGLKFSPVLCVAGLIVFNITIGIVGVLIGGFL